MNWIITENKEQECPGFAVDYLPCHITAKLRIMYKDQQLYLVADGIAGVIPCKRGHSITILPKCKELNPFSMYEYITGLAIQQENKQSIDFNGSGIDLMMNSPSAVDDKQLDELNLMFKPDLD